MKICIIWKNDYPWDVRIEKFANSLKKAGHDIYLLCSNKGKLQEHELISGIKIYRLPFANNNLLNSLISAPFYFNPFWLKMVNRIVRQEKIDLLIVRDLPLILIGILMKKYYHIPLILDMAENYPALYRRIIENRGWGKWFIKNPYLIEWIEKYALKHVDHLFVVIEESAKRLISMGVQEKKISIVSNTPDLCIFKKGKQFDKGIYFQMIYVGFVNEGRGLDTVISSLDKIKKLGFKIKLIIIGNGSCLEELKYLAKKEQVENIVEFKGWIKNTEIPQLVDESDVGVIPHRKLEHTDTTIPNKLFDFMACGKPVIVSDAAPMKRIVEEEKCGVVFKSGNVENFVRAFQEIASNFELLHKMGANGRKAVERKYNWENDSLVLTQVITRFQNK